MPKSSEITTVKNNVDGVSCDGGGNGMFGHPKVWYDFNGSDTIKCNYCERLFKKPAKTASGAQ